MCEIVLWRLNNFFTFTLQEYEKVASNGNGNGYDKMIMIKMAMLVYVNACDDCNDCNSEGECKKRRMGPLSFHSLI